jgi:hypothetical protein
MRRRMSSGVVAVLAVTMAAVLTVASGAVVPSAAAAQTATPPPGMPAFPTGALPAGGEGGAFARLAERLAAAPGVPWSIDGDLVVPALPEFSHLTGDLADLDELAGRRFAQLDAQLDANSSGSGVFAAGAAGAIPSLAAALLGVAASDAGQSLDRFLGENLAAASSLTGLSTFSLARSSARDLDQLDFFLIGAGVGLPSGSLASPELLLSRLSGDGVDQRVTANSAAFARSLWQLNVPELPTAPTPDVDAAALGFALLTNRSLAAMAAEFPDVFSQARSTGLGSEEGRAVWRQSLRMAFDAVEPDLAATLPSSCLAGMLSVAATGTPGSAERFRGCEGDCQAAGVYLNRQLQGLWNPSMFSTLPADDGVLSQSELGRLPGWVGSEVDAQLPPAGSNQPSPGSSASQSLASSFSGACATAEPAAGALGRTLPDLWSGLLGPG